LLLLEKEGKLGEAVQEVSTAVNMDPQLKGAQQDLKRMKPWSRRRKDDIVNRKVSPWLDFPTLRSNSSMRLFCFPYAGGSGAIFRGWQKAFSASVDVCPIQLPGRGSRIREPMMKRVDSVVTALKEELKPYLDRPFAFFGYSMGATIAFELTRSLRNELCPQPVQLFVAARRSPDWPASEERDYDLPAAELIARLRDLNGTPKEILDNPEAMELMLPLVRADFEIIQTYEYKPQPPLQVPIDAFAGSEDVDTPPERMEGWKGHTTSEFSLTVIPGDHFFFHHAQKELLELLTARINRVLNRIQPRHVMAVQ
jgi:medium-chain acyl-[acyl-carrier-protein] hydrolase